MGISENMKNKRFDIDMFEKNKKNGSYEFTLEDGTEITQLEAIPSGYAEWQSYPNKFYEIYKEYYSNAKIKLKEYRFFRIRIRISEHYDENENKTLVNEDEKFGKFDYNQLISLLDKKGYVNSKTAEGKENINVGFSSNKNVWEVEIQRENELPRKLIIDGNTGHIIKVENVIRLE
jgi:hypothetical protein